MATVMPTGPLVGVKALTVSGGGVTGTVTVKADELIALPAGVVTEMGPVVAPLGTVARMREPEAMV
jgi:hypothetical protein